MVTLNGFVSFSVNNEICVPLVFEFLTRRPGNKNININFKCILLLFTKISVRTLY